MYCANCGVKLGDAEKQCPLCGTAAFHPQLQAPTGEPLYPRQSYPVPQVTKLGALVVLTTAFLVPLLITLLCDLRINRTVTWSGYVVGALLMAYEIIVLPLWFRKPNPVIFVPCGFTAVGLYLLYIDLATGGGWFLSFAFPLVGGLMLIVTAVVALLHYLRRGVLYILGGAFILSGAFAPVMEYLVNLTFRLPFVGWSIYPMVSLVLLGGMLLFLAICRPARETMERKLFF